MTILRNAFKFGRPFVEIPFGNTVDPAFRWNTGGTSSLATEDDPTAGSESSHFVRPKNGTEERRPPPDRTCSGPASQNANRAREYSDIWWLVWRRY